MTEKRANALCVGIDKYNDIGKNIDLEGCVNDAKSIQLVLTEILKIPNKNIVELTNYDATKARIVKELVTLVDKANSGDYIFFSMASHGTQIPNPNEPDGADEAFCPTDIAVKNEQWDPKHLIIDDELHDIFSKLKPGILLEVFLDTCHSGDGLRNLSLDQRERYLRPPTGKGVEKLRDRKLPKIRELLIPKTRGEEAAHQILWSACTSNETSAEKRLGQSIHGAFTYFFCKEIESSNNTLCRKDLHEKVKKDLREDKFSQNPQLEAEDAYKDKPIQVQK